ncbi:MAG: substrate-binding domain-containing protein [Kiritimatiellae bacterium]|nr:substrate-binding domain-containing protein [Kiritimatiellia bacterium]
MKHKTILFFVSIDRRCFDEQIDGIFRHADSKNWHIQFVEKGPVAAMRRSIDFWKPDGIIIEYGDDKIISPSLFGNVPTVLLDIGKREPPDGFNIVKLDSGAVGRMGAEHLLGLNLKTYAYVGFMRTAVWDEERRTAFASAIHKAGCDYKEFWHVRNLTPAARHARLYSWIKALPKPCGLMACNDAVGEEILNICSQLGIHVPNDIAVLGADNDMRLCENTVPTLASIDSGIFQEGMDIVRILDGLMTDDAANERQPVVMAHKPIRVVLRQSVRRLVCDRSKVASALELIRRRACEGITVNDVASAMGVSRRVAEKHFRMVTNKSILQEILDRRFEEVFELLRNPNLKIGAIAGMSGFSSEMALRKIFRERMGCSMRDWRERQCQIS